MGRKQEWVSGLAHRQNDKEPSVSLKISTQSRFPISFHQVLSLPFVFSFIIPHNSRSSFLFPLFSFIFIVSLSQLFSIFRSDPQLSLHQKPLIIIHDAWLRRIQCRGLVTVQTRRFFLFNDAVFVFRR